LVGPEGFEPSRAYFSLRVKSPVSSAS